MINSKNNKSKRQDGKDKHTDTEMKNNIKHDSSNSVINLFRHIRRASSKRKPDVSAWHKLAMRVCSHDGNRGAWSPLQIVWHAICGLSSLIHRSPDGMKHAISCSCESTWIYLFWFFLSVCFRLCIPYCYPFQVGPWNHSLYFAALYLVSLCRVWIHMTSNITYIQRRRDLDARCHGVAITWNSAGCEWFSKRKL